MTRMYTRHLYYHGVLVGVDDRLAPCIQQFFFHLLGAC
jgi:hypothetical protein